MANYTSVESISIAAAHPVDEQCIHVSEAILAQGIDDVTRQVA